MCGIHVYSKLTNNQPRPCDYPNNAPVRETTDSVQMMKNQLFENYIIAPKLLGPANSLGGIGTITKAGTKVGCCGEFRLANELLLQNPELLPSQIEFTNAVIIKDKGSAVLEMCGNCSFMFTEPIPKAPYSLPALGAYTNTANTVTNDTKDFNLNH